jgi:hypothetical protein
MEEKWIGYIAKFMSIFCLFCYLVKKKNMNLNIRFFKKKRANNKSPKRYFNYSATSLRPAILII